MVARDDLVQRAHVCVSLEHNEVLEQVEELLPVEHANNLKRDQFAEEGTRSVLIDRERRRSYQ